VKSAQLLGGRRIARGGIDGGLNGNGERERRCRGRLLDGGGGNALL
jgi:hypothetical protein